MLKKMINLLYPNGLDCLHMSEAQKVKAMSTSMRKYAKDTLKGYSNVSPIHWLVKTWCITS